MEHNAIVFIELNGVPVPAGRMRITEDSRWSRSEFAYGRRYLERPDAVAIDPVMLPLSDKAYVSPEDFPLFNGIRDAAPDAWGRKLIDQFILRKFNRPASEAEYLLASQRGARIGALQFGTGPEGPGQVLDYALPDISSSLGSLEDFQALVDGIEHEDAIPDRLSQFIAPGSDLGGARPKGTVMIEGFPWLVKFGIERDRLPLARVEAACLDLAEMAGVQTCERQVIDIAGRPALLLKRFDRALQDDGSMHKIHMISSMTLMGAHESDKGTHGYADIYNALRRHGAPGNYSEDIYRRMLVNVLTGNCDDHFRNHAFLQGSDGLRPSPVYDVNPTLQAGFTRHLFMHLGKAGAGREATLENAVAGGASLGLSRDHAVIIANEVSEVIGKNWRDVMMRRGVDAASIQLVEGAFGQAGRKIDADDLRCSL